MNDALALITECNDKSGKHRLAKLGIDVVEKCGKRELNCPALLRLQLARSHHISDYCGIFTFLAEVSRSGRHVNSILLTLAESIELY